MADAITSELAIVAILAGSFFGWVWMDPLMTIGGAVVIARWSWNLMRAAGAMLVDAVPNGDTAQRILGLLKQNGDRVSDLHLWRVGPGHLAAIVSLVADHPLELDIYHKRLQQITYISHVTVEVHRCRDTEDKALKHSLATPSIDGRG